MRTDGKAVRHHLLSQKSVISGTFYIIFYSMSYKRHPRRSRECEGSGLFRLVSVSCSYRTVKWKELGRKCPLKPDAAHRVVRIRIIAEISCPCSTHYATVFWEERNMQNVGFGVTSWEEYQPDLPEQQLQLHYARLLRWLIIVIIILIIIVIMQRD